MKTKQRVALIFLCAALLIVSSVMGTMAYLTDRQTVTNTFTVGNVGITLDEAKVDIYGAETSPAERVNGNSYKLLPGHTYTKDPTVTVEAGSEKCYVKMTVTVSESAALDTIFGPSGANLLSIFTGYNSSNWIYKGNTVDLTADTRTYEFWYKEEVDALNNDVELDALFDSFTVPSAITGTQLATIDGMTITCKAYAIQSDGFANAAAAWAAFN